MGVMYANVGGVWQEVMGQAGPTGPAGPAGAMGATGATGPMPTGALLSVVAGNSVVVDSTDPANPIVGVLLPAEAGPAVVAADARFGNVNAIDGAGFTATSTGVLYADVAAGQYFQIRDAAGTVVLSADFGVATPEFAVYGPLTTNGTSAKLSFNDQAALADWMDTYYSGGVLGFYASIGGGCFFVKRQGRAEVYMTEVVGNDWSNAALGVNNVRTDNSRISLYVGGIYGWAPQWRCHGSLGDSMGCLTSDGANFAPVNASAFTVSLFADDATAVRSVDQARDPTPGTREPLSDVVDGLDIMALRPVVYRPTHDPQRITSTGDPDNPVHGFEPIALDHPLGIQGRRERLGLLPSEVATVLPSAVSHDDQGEAYGVDYAQITVALIDEVQRLRQFNADLIAALQAVFNPADPADASTLSALVAK